MYSKINLTENLSMRSDFEIGDLHLRVHQLWDNPKEDRDELVEAHVSILKEMVYRQGGFNHVTVDDLDRMSMKTIRDSGTVQLKSFFESDGSDSPFYDLVCVVREAERAILKVPLPGFLITRLKSGKSALLLTGSNRGAAEGKEFLLVNERLKKNEGTSAWGTITFSIGREFSSMDQLTSSEKESVDPLMLREFALREPPFFILKLKLVKAFPNPVKLDKLPAGRFSGKTDFKESHKEESFNSFFVVRGERAIDMGNELPKDTIVLEDSDQFAIITKKDDTNAAVMFSSTKEAALSRGGEQAEESKDPNSVFIVGQAVGKLGNQLVFKDIIGFRFIKDDDRDE